MDKIRKGRTQTREWLEQKIPFLLTPVLQDFRVHSIESSAGTQIPQGKVIIVIDVGDSLFAPHQSNADYHYYYRAGGHSRFAPHQHLQLLWRRETFPGPKIAGAWVYNFINQILHIPESEKNYLNDRKWDFDSFHPACNKGLQNILEKYNSGNYEQFYEFYPEILELITRHDGKVAEFIESLKMYFLAIKNSPKMVSIFEKTTTLKSLQKLKDEKYSQWNYRLLNCTTTEDFRKELFSTLTKSEILARLAGFIINGYSKIHDSDLAPYWNVYCDKFLPLYEADTKEKSQFENAAKRLLTEIESLYIALKKQRGLLCTEYNLPYEELPQVVIQNDRYGIGSF